MGRRTFQRRTDNLGNKGGHFRLPQPKQRLIQYLDDRGSRFNISDETGKKIQEGELNEGNQYTTTIQKLQEGLYFVTSWSAGSTTTKKVIVTQ